MTLSSHEQSRISALDAALKMIEQRGRKAIRLATVGVALVAAGISAPGTMLADDAAFDPPTQNERSIALIESKEVPADTTAFQPPTANERSIGLTESKEAPAGVGADWPTLESGQTANERSIALIEGSDPANVPMTASDSIDETTITRRPGSWDA